MIYDLACLGDHRLQVLIADKTFGVDLVDILRARRSRGEPAIFGDDLQAADAGIVSGGFRQLGLNGFTGQGGRGDGFRGQLFEARLLGGAGGLIDPGVTRLAELGDDILIVLSRIFARYRQDFCSQQIQDDAVLIGGPDAAIVPQKTRPGTFFAAETQRAVEQAVDKPFEAHGDLHQFPAEMVSDAVDHTAADQCLADTGTSGPAGTMCEEVLNGDCQVMVGIHQTDGRSHDPMAVGIGVVAEGEIEPVFEFDQAGHRIRAGTIHANLAIVVDRHESELRVSLVIYDGDIQSIPFGDRSPIPDAGPTQGVGSQLDSRRFDRVEIHNVGQIGDVGIEQISRVRRAGLEGGVVRDPLHGRVLATQDLVGSVLHHAGDVGVGRSTVRRVIFEPAIFGGIMGGSDDDPICQARCAAAVIAQDGMRHDGRRREAVAVLDDGLDAVGRQNFQGSTFGRCGQSVRVFPQKQRASNPFRLAELDQRLGDGRNVGIGKRAVARGPPMAAGAEADELQWIIGIGLLIVIGRQQTRNINQQ